MHECLNLLAIPNRQPLIIVFALLMLLFLYFASSPVFALEIQPIQAAQAEPMEAPEAIPDLREEETNLKLQNRNLVIVPIPSSNPTLETGIALSGIYFHPQTEEEKKVQPPSVTGAVVYYSNNGSSAFGLTHRSYLKENRWRLGGAFGHTDLNLELQQSGSGPTIDWFVRGDFLAASVSRKISGKWYAGVFTRHHSMNQSFGIEVPGDQFSVESEVKSAGLGINLEYDNRDKPFNSYSGNVFKFSVLVNGSALGSDNHYESYGLEYRSYHTLSPSLVLAWEAQACSKLDKAPLWDACRISLRGFSSTDYLGKSSASAQLEARWRFHNKWGAVAFAGSGYYKNPFSENRNREAILSYGVGLRFMVLESQRINIRLDYARSTGSDAVYLSIGEAF